LIVFEKLTRTCFFQIALETILLAIQKTFKILGFLICVEDYRMQELNELDKLSSMLTKTSLALIRLVEIYSVVIFLHVHGIVIIFFTVSRSVCIHKNFLLRI
jgi:hypothetical protein